VFLELDNSKNLALNPSSDITSAYESWMKKYFSGADITKLCRVTDALRPAYCHKGHKKHTANNEEHHNEEHHNEEHHKKLSKKEQKKAKKDEKKHKKQEKKHKKGKHDKKGKKGKKDKKDKKGKKKGKGKKKSVKGEISHVQKWLDATKNSVAQYAAPAAIALQLEGEGGEHKALAHAAYNQYQAEECYKHYVRILHHCTKKGKCLKKFSHLETQCATFGAKAYGHLANMKDEE